MLEDGGNRLRRIIVSGNREVDKLGVGVGVHEGEGGDVQAAGLGDGNVLLVDVDDEQGTGQTGEVGDRTEVLVELGTLALHLEALTLADIVEILVVHQSIEAVHLLDSLADGLEVGEHTARPTLGDEGHVHALSHLGDDLFGLLLGGHEEDLLAALGHLLQGSGGLVGFDDGFLEVDDVNAVVLLEDIRSHFGIPFALEVAEVATSLEQFFEFEFVHVCLLSFLLLNFYQSSGRP